MLSHNLTCVLVSFFNEFRDSDPAVQKFYFVHLFQDFNIWCDRHFNILRTTKDPYLSLTSVYFHVEFFYIKINPVDRSLVICNYLQNVSMKSVNEIFWRSYSLKSSIERKKIRELAFLGIQRISVLASPEGCFQVWKIRN